MPKKIPVSTLPKNGKHPVESENLSPWLDNYGFVIERTSKRIKQYFQRKFNDLGVDITVDQWVILDVLRKYPGLSQFEIAAHTFKDPPTLTRIIDLLCKKNLAVRKVDPKDRRRFRVFLTPTGEKKVEKLIPEVKMIRFKGWKSLDEGDNKAMLRILDKVFDNFE